MDRRAFLAATIATPMIQGQRTVSPSVGQSFEADNLTKADLSTPALILDLDVFEENLRRMAEHCRIAGVGFRPHAMTHKCPEIARRQVASGALGICVATVAEAEAIVAAGIRGVL